MAKQKKNQDVEIVVEKEGNVPEPESVVEDKKNTESVVNPGPERSSGPYETPPQTGPSSPVSVKSNLLSKKQENVETKYGPPFVMIKNITKKTITIPIKGVSFVFKPGDSKKFSSILAVRKFSPELFLITPFDADKKITR